MSSRTDAEITTLLSDLINEAAGVGDLQQEQESVLEDDLHRCSLCPKKYKHKYHLNRHQRQKHSSEFICGNCLQQFSNSEIFTDHQKTCQGGASKRQRDEDNIPESKKRRKIQSGEGVVKENNKESVESAIDGNLKVHQMSLNKAEKYDLSLTLQGKKKTIMKRLQKELEEKRGLKWFLCSQIRMIKTTSDLKEETTSPHFRSASMKTLRLDQLETQFDEAVEKIKKSFLEFQREGSGWRLDQVLNLTLNVATYKPLNGSSYIDLPKELKEKKAILNIKNNDEKCFLWSVLAAKHPIHKKDHPYRMQHYQQYEEELNMSGIDFPVKINQLSKFEKQNPTTSINVFGYEDQELFPLYITENKKVSHVNLLLISNGDKNHYCLVKNLSRLLGDRTKHNGQTYYCCYCLHGFVREDLLLEHEPLCSIHGPQKIKLPGEEDNILSFKDVQKQLRVPFVIYADFETILMPCDEAQIDSSLSHTIKTQHHKPSGFCYCIVSDQEKYCKPPLVYRGENCVDKFLEHLVEEEKRILEILEHVVPLNMTPEKEQAFQKATKCHICKNDLEGDRVRDHDHLTGEFRGAAHNECNINYKFSGKIPVIFHNSRGFDSHLIMQSLGKIKDHKINCIPNNTEKYIAFSVGKLEFIDSLQFMNASLEGLVSNLAKEGHDKFPVLRRYTTEAKIPYLLRKGIFPYEYFDNFSRFEEKGLPNREAFFSTLKGEGISDQDYEHAQQVYQIFHCQNLGDYHDLYLQSDVLLLADVFENFRNICLQYYELDPCHFYTSPGLSWQACLKMTGIELELLTDPNMLLFIEQGMRGGISVICNRFAKANNPYVEGYDPQQDKNYLLYLDANNLYGFGMSQSLPYEEFRWLTEQEIEHLDVRNISDDGEEGYILEVDLEYPSELHVLHNDYPLAPEQMKVSNDMLSPYSQQLFHELEMNCHTSVNKLVPNLNNKSHYILHYRNLKQYLSLGMKLGKVHKVLAFHQSRWLKTYIDFNTLKRKHATNGFEKDFFKLMNNSVFGKTMENLRKRVNVKLVNTPKQLKKLTASPLFDYFRIFNEDLAAVNLRKPTLFLNRPIYVGFCILDLSKVLMYDFHYNFIKKKYGSKATLCFTDTDSLMYDIKTEDVYADMGEAIDLFDTSEYAPDHPLHSTRNKKVIGKMKDETHGIPIREFVGLRSKMYSFLYEEGGQSIEKKTAKGISKNVTKRDIRHAHYKESLFARKRFMANMNRIQSFKHELYTVNLNKIGLSPYDDKRYILSNGISTLAYGHASITH